MWSKKYWPNSYWSKNLWSNGEEASSPECNTGFIGKIDGSDIGFQGKIDSSDIGFNGLVTDKIAFQGNIEPIIQVTKIFNANQGSMIYGILTLSVTAEPIGIGFQGKIEGSDIGFQGHIDDSDIGFNGIVCGC